MPAMTLCHAWLPGHGSETMAACWAWERTICAVGCTVGGVTVVMAAMRK